MHRWNEPEFWHAMDVIHKTFFALPKEGEKYNAYILMLQHWAILLATVGFHLYGIVGFIFHGYSDGLRHELIESLHIVVNAVMDVLCTMIYFSLGERIRKLIHGIKCMSNEVPMNVAKGYIYLNKLIWSTFYGIFAVIIFVGLISFFFDAHCEARKRIGDKRYMCGLLNPVWYPFEIDDSSRWKFFFALYTSIGSAAMLTFYSVTMVGFIGMAYIITLRMQDLTMHLMEFDERNIQDLEEKFDSLVEYFSEIQKFVKDVNQTFGYCCIVVYVLITVCVALLEYICLVDGSIKNFTFLFGCIGLQYTWCSVGQNLEDEHQKLIYSIEDLPWYNMSPQMKKNYRLFLSSAHMPLQIRIYPHIDVNHKYLLSVFQGSYSITTFLINSSSRR